MGLNLRIENERTGYMSREARYRLWWSLYVLDIIICMMAGRPPGTAIIFCSTPLPVPFKEEDFPNDRVMQLVADLEARNLVMDELPIRNVKRETPSHRSSGAQRQTAKPTDTAKSDEVASKCMEILTPNMSLFFVHLVDLVSLMQGSIEELYAPAAVQKPDHEIDLTMSTLNDKTDSWLSGLPVAFHFIHGTHEFERERCTLAFCFYMTKILITKPCLSRLAQQHPGVGPAEKFCTYMAQVCVDVADQMLHLLPHEPDPLWVYRVSPWWCAVHYLMQPTTVLLVEFFRTKRGTSKHKRLLGLLSKSISWLDKMSTTDSSAQRAWLVCRDLLTKHIPGLSPASPTEPEPESRS